MRNAFAAIVGIDSLVLAAALWVGLFPWLGMDGLDIVVPLAAPALVALHLVVAWIIWSRGFGKAGQIVLGLAAGWTGAAVIGHTVMQDSLDAQVLRAEAIVASERECSMTRPDYYPAGALIHCKVGVDSDSAWTTIWVRSGPFRAEPWSLKMNERF